jgi:hypothetical protein
VKYRLRGLEWEVAFVHRPGAPKRTPPAAAFLYEVARHFLRGGWRKFHTDGSKRYVDGGVLEACSRPRRSSRGAVATFVALEHRLMEASEAAARAHVHYDSEGNTKVSIALTKTNSAPGVGKLKTPHYRGTQENYEIRDEHYAEIVSQLTPFLVARGILTESGDVISDDDGNAVFVRSSRAPVRRPMDPLIRWNDADRNGMRRVEVRTQGVSYSQKMLVFKMHMTDLVLRALERERGDEGHPPEAEVDRLNVIFLGVDDAAKQAYKDWHGTDPPKRVAVSINGVEREMTPLELLEVYRKHAEKFLPADVPGVRDQEDIDTFAMWNRLTRQLETDPQSTIGEVEWTTRKAYFDKIAAKWEKFKKSPLPYAAAKQLMTSIEIISTDQAQMTAIDGALQGLLSKGRLFTEEEIAQAEIPTPSEGAQCDRAYAVKEILSWPEEDRRCVTIDWGAAQIADSMRLPDRVVLFSDALESVSQLREIQENVAASVGSRQRAASTAPAPNDLLHDMAGERPSLHQSSFEGGPPSADGREI